MKEVPGRLPFETVPQHFASRSHEKMKEVLMNPDARGPKPHYYMIRGDMRDGRGNNITVWEPGLIDREYVKTYGHYHVGKLDETYSFLSGKGIALLQKLAVDANGNMIPDVVEEFKAIRVGEGGLQELFIPAGYGHLVANIGEDFLVTSDDSPVNFGEVNPASLPGHADYELVKKMHGFAYYVVSHNGKLALEKNKLYREIKRVVSGDIPLVPED